MSKQITIQLNERLFKPEDIKQMRYIASIVSSIVATIDPIWGPRLKSDTVPTSWHLDSGNNWWAHFASNTVTINSRYGSDRLMDAVADVLVYRLPLQWEPTIVTGENR